MMLLRAFFLIILSALGYQGYAQLSERKVWERTSHTDSVPVQVLAVVNGSVYSGTYGYGMYVSHDRGDKWTSVYDILPAEVITAVLPVSKKRIYVTSADAGVHVSTDGGTSWTRQVQGLDYPGVHSVAVQDKRVYIGTIDGLFTKRFRDSVWHRIVLDTLPEARSNMIADVFVEDKLIVAASSGLIYYSLNRGRRWQVIEDGLFADVTFVRRVGEKLLVGTAGDGIFELNLNRRRLSLEEGAFANHRRSIVVSLFMDGSTPVILSNNRGVSSKRRRFNKGLRKENATALVKVRGRYLLGTFDNGVMAYKRPDDAALEQPYQAAMMASDIDIYPNPATDKATVRYELNEPSSVTVTVRTIDGAVLKTLPSQWIEPVGQGQRTFSVAELPPGRYLIEVAGKSLFQHKILIVQ